MRRARAPLLLSLFGLARGDSHTTVTYAILSGGTRCESEGYADILTSAECETAAAATVASMTTNTRRDVDDRDPRGSCSCAA